MKKILARNVAGTTPAKYSVSDDVNASNIQEVEKIVLRNAKTADVPAGAKLADFGCGTVLAGELAQVSDLPDDFESRKRKIEYDRGWGFEFSDGAQETFRGSEFLLATRDGIFVA